MPKILINEIDKTTPGTPNGYSNYAVLLPGFRGRTPVLLADAKPGSDIVADKVQPDSNGVYEFSNVQDFLDTIRPVAPHYDLGGVSISHFGNQMAYELLKQGYSVIYLPFDPEKWADTLLNKATWDMFKDKANYDFRFVSHGLLESSDTTKLEQRMGALHTAITALNEVLNSTDIAESDRFTISADTVFDGTVTAEHEELYQDLYSTLGSSQEIVGLKDPYTDEYYASCDMAIAGVLTEIKSLESKLSGVITSGTIETVNGLIADLVTYIASDVAASAELPGRGDCVALVELDENAYATAQINPERAILDAIEKTSFITEANGKYCAMTVPSVVYIMADDVQVKSGTEIINNPFANNKKFPGAFHYLTCFMNALRAGYAEWYAAAGYTRGVSNYSIDYTTVTLGEIAINALEPRNRLTDANKYACNVIANFRGSYYLYSYCI